MKSTTHRSSTFQFTFILLPSCWTDLLAIWLLFVIKMWYSLVEKSIPCALRLFSVLSSPHIWLYSKNKSVWFNLLKLTILFRLYNHLCGDDRTENSLSASGIMCSTILYNILIAESNHMPNKSVQQDECELKILWAMSCWLHCSSTLDSISLRVEKFITPAFHRNINFCIPQHYSWNLIIEVT